MTPEQVYEEVKRDYRDLQLQIRELRVEIKEQLQRIKLLVWLPVIVAAAQILTQLAVHFHWF